MADIDTLIEEIVAFRDERDWKQFHNPKDCAISLTLEAAELLEHFQWKSTEEVLQHIEKSREAISEELVDVLYWILLMSHDMNINLADAFENKMKKNQEKYPVETAKGKHTKYDRLQ